MAKITVTVTTQKEENTRFDELLKASRLAKEAAEELKNKTQPFIDLAGEAKFDEIVRQCNAFIERAKKVFEVIGYRNMDILCNGLKLFVCSTTEHVDIQTTGGTSINDVKRVGLLPRILSDKDRFVATWNDFDRLGTFERAVEKEMKLFIARKECDMRDRVELFNKITDRKEGK